MIKFTEPNSITSLFEDWLNLNLTTISEFGGGVDYWRFRSVAAVTAERLGFPAVLVEVWWTDEVEDTYVHHNDCEAGLCFACEDRDKAALANTGGDNSTWSIPALEAHVEEET